MRKVLVALMVLGMSAPAVAQAPQAQWYECFHTMRLKGGKTKTVRTDICETNGNSAYYTAVTLFSKKLYGNRLVATPDQACRPTHEACVR